LQAPLRKIGERRMSHEMRKTLRKHCARHARFFRQFCKCPCACRCWGEGERNSVRSVNLMRVRDGLIVEGLGYVKVGT
jgi:hypothetical protein